jgi:hypothetical protein
MDNPMVYVALGTFLGGIIVSIVTKLLGRDRDTIEKRMDRAEAKIAGVHDEVADVKGNYNAKFAKVHDHLNRVHLNIQRDIGDIKVALARCPVNNVAEGARQSHSTDEGGCV